MKLYIAQPAYQTKNGKDVEKKADIVGMVEAVLGIKAESLVKAGKADLERLRDAVVREAAACAAAEVEAES